MDGILNGRYEELKQKLTGHMLNTLNFYNDLFNKGEKILRTWNLYNPMP